MSGADFDTVFARLRTIMLDACDARMEVTKDAPGDLVVRTRALDTKGQPGWFGMVAIKKSYVSYHLMPLYEHPALAEALPPELAKRRQGKTCFNFRAVDDAVFAQLAELSAAAADTVPDAS